MTSHDTCWYIYNTVLYALCFQYLKKLHLQERVVEEVKMAIKPHYANKDIDKYQYKEILRKAVPKVGNPFCFTVQVHHSVGFEKTKAMRITLC